MRRRTFLASAGLAALAGCSNGNEPTTTSTPTPTMTTTGSGSAKFELRGAKFPDTQSLNSPIAFAIGIRNTGTAAGTFTTTLETKVGDGKWTDAGEIEMPLKPGETGEWHSPRFIVRYLTTYHVRLSDFEKVWTIEIKPKRLDFGNFYAVPTDLYINVLGGSFESTYPVSSTNETSTTTPTKETPTNGSAPTPTPTTPTDGDQWVVMRVDVRNRLEKPQTAPPADSFVLEVDGERRPQHQEVSDDPYKGGKLKGRTVRRGDLVYSVPEGTKARDLRLTWSQSLPKGDVKAIWTK